MFELSFCLIYKLIFIFDLSIIFFTFNFENPYSSMISINAFLIAILVLVTLISVILFIVSPFLSIIF